MNRLVSSVLAAALAVSLTPALSTSAEIIQAPAENIRNGNKGPQFPATLTIADGAPDEGQTPDSKWNYQPYIMDPAKPDTRLDRFYLKVASGANGQNNDMRLNGSHFSNFVTGSDALTPGEGDIRVSSSAGEPMANWTPDKPIWTLITESDPHANETTFNDMALGLQWNDVDQNGLANPGDTIDILGVLYSTGDDKLEGKTPDELGKILKDSGSSETEADPSEESRSEADEPM